ncbi:MAG: hypothetical protein R3E48_23415, partial [Burkholderiaceae bacterium]
MRRFGYPRPAFLVGFVLSDQAENYLYQSVQFYGFNFVTRPGVIIIGVLAALSIWAATRSRVSEQGSVRLGGTSTGEVEVARPARRWPQIVFVTLIVAALLFALWSTYGLSFLGKVFPASMATLTLPFALWLLVSLGTGPRQSTANHDQEQTGEHVGNPEVANVWTSVAWFALLFGLTGLVGFVMALVVFMMAYLIMRTRLGLAGSIAYTAVAIGGMAALGHFLTLDFPAGLLQSYVELPWPLK